MRVNAIAVSAAPSGVGRRGGNRTLRAAAAGACALALVLAGCSDDPTDPGDDSDATGSMDTAVRDSDGTGEASDEVAFDLAAQSDSVSGQVSGEATVEVRLDDGTWEEVGALADLDVDAELRSDQRRTMGSAEVEARTYEGVRVVFESMEADLDAGSDVGVGPIQVSVTVAVAGGEQVVVEHDAPVTVEADANTDITVDLNSHVWLDQESVEAEAVAASEFEGAAAVEVE